MSAHLDRLCDLALWRLGAWIDRDVEVHQREVAVAFAQTRTAMKLRHRSHVLVTPGVWRVINDRLRQIVKGERPAARCDLSGCNFPEGGCSGECLGVAS